MFETALSLMIFLPILTGGFFFLPKIKTDGRSIAFLVSFSILILAVQIFINFDPEGGRQFIVQRTWLNTWGIQYALGIDGINLLVLLTNSFLFPFLFCVLKKQNRYFHANLLICQGAMTGAILASDLVLFYIFWELMLLPVFFSIGLYGGRGRIAATWKITLYTIAGSLLMLAALTYVAVSYHHATGNWSFDIGELSTLNLEGRFAITAFLMFMFAFAIKIPIFPFHTWLPDAYTEAPPAITFALSAIMAKIGVYGIIRFVIPLFAPEFIRFASFFLMLAIVGMIYCGIAAVGQKDIKRMLAFSSASHMGLIATGLFALNVQALTGSLFQIMAHATSMGLLFLFVGILEEQLHSREIETLGGLAYRAPLFATFFAVAMLASVGLPGTSGFVGEFLIILGTVKHNFWLGVFAGTALLVGVCYMLWMFQRVFFEKENSVSLQFSDLRAREALVFLPALLLIFFMGFFPGFFLSKIEPAVQQQLAELYKVSSSEKIVCNDTAIKLYPLN